MVSHSMPFDLNELSSMKSFQGLIFAITLLLCLAFPVIRTQGVRGPVYFQSPYAGIYYYMYHQPEHRIGHVAAMEQCRRAHHGQLISLNGVIRQQLLATMANLAGGRRDLWVGAWNNDRYQGRCLALTANGSIIGLSFYKLFFD